MGVECSSYFVSRGGRESGVFCGDIQSKLSGKGGEKMEELGDNGKILEGNAGKNMKGVLRVLEVGAGTESISWAILPQIAVIWG